MNRRPSRLRHLGRASRSGPGLPTVGGPVLLTPPGLQVTARHLEIGDVYTATVTVIGYPREVGPGWLEPLLAHPGRVDVAVHVEPIPPPVAAVRLRRQLGRLESGRRAEATAGRLADPELDAAAHDAADLAGRLARGESRLFALGLYVTVYADSADELAEERARVTALAHSLLLSVQPATFRAVQGWATSLPLGVDLLRLRRTFDTQALAAAFPFSTPDLPVPDVERPGAGPVVYGANLHSAGLVVHDRWAMPNYNSVTLAASGAGKSYLTKLDVLRSLYQGVQVAVVDPEDEYAQLSAAAGGTRLALGAPGVHLNPLDLPAHARHDPDLRTRRALFCHTLLATLLGGRDDQDSRGGLDAAGRAAVDRAILAAYRAAGISADPATWDRPAPLLKDVAGALATDAEDPAGPALAGRLAPFTTGSHRTLFDGPTSTSPQGHLIVFSLRQLPDELRPAGTLLTLDAIWRQVADPAHRRRRMVVVDEAWMLMAHPAGARFLFQLAKAARKHWTGLAVVTQDAADLLGSDLGRAVVANAATQILLRQDPTAITDIRATFHLSAGEAAHLLTARPGDALLITGPGRRTAFHANASRREHALITTDPAEAALPGLAGTSPDSGPPADDPAEGLSAVTAPAPAQDADPC
ncbi:VirB4 family type IV secretion system protein [Frankia sp. CiP3]|uniref:VirB4 family type IV secretion system protein n=1 Tax=Frankia sp. CiP3 TaxID=2880971 RepID=UPI001EF5F5EB|nr:conjugal transfer protein TraC [Frankia sp. CiP3]